ncbi:MAG TPA: hypothetical protein PL123_14670, partial [Bacteroidales bacterium]|nr:hypothetical protein [Bacteroidales bacterium]
MTTTRNSSSGKGGAGRWQRGMRAKSAPSVIVLFMIFFLTVIDVGKAYSQQGVAISESPATPDQWAILDLQSSLRGFLAPRMTTAQRLTLGTKPPAQGMLVYDTDTKSFWYFD